MKRERSMQAADSLKQSLSVSLQCSMELAQEKGSSVWLTSLPIHKFSFALHKHAFQDALALRYNWQPLQAPSVCGCGTKFSIEHSLSCPKGGFLPFDITKLGTWQLIYLQKFAMMSALSLNFYPLTG